MKELFLIDSSKLQCNCGSTVSSLRVTSQTFSQIDGKLQATEEDKKPNENILPFGICSITQKSCVPAPVKWQNAINWNTVNGMASITNNSKLTCSIGGSIKCIEEGQDFSVIDNTPKTNFNQKVYDMPHQEDIFDDEICFIDGYWASDKNGENKITEAVLGDKVYFIIQTTENLPQAEYFDFQLREHNDGKWIFLWLIPPYRTNDTYQDVGLVSITGEGTDYEKVKDYDKETAVNNKAVIGFTIAENSVLRKMLDNDPKRHLQLYFFVSYGYDKKTLPKDKDLYLKVKYNPKNNLVIVPPVNGYPFPEFFSLEGNPIVMSLIQNSTGFISSEQISKLSYQIALRELKMGKLYNNIGEVHTTKRLVYNVNQSPIDGKDYYIVRGSNFGYKNAYVNNGKLVTTKGLNQVEYFANAGAKNNLLKMSSKILEIGVIDLASMIVDASEGKMSIFPPMDLIVDYASADLDETIEETFYRDLENAKIGGIQKLQSFINSNNIAGNKRYFIEPISNSTLERILRGDLTDYYELIDYMATSEDGHIKNNHLLMLDTFNSQKNMKEYLIVSIFINN